MHSGIWKAAVHYSIIHRSRLSCLDMTLGDLAEPIVSLYLNLQQVAWLIRFALLVHLCHMLTVTDSYTETRFMHWYIWHRGFASKFSFLSRIEGGKRPENSCMSGKLNWISSFPAPPVTSCSCGGAELVIYTLNSLLRQVYKALQRRNQPLSKNNHQHSWSGLRGWLLSRLSSETVSTWIFMAANIDRPLFSPLRKS